MTTETTRGHTYDGIEEFDNRLPNWWLWTFYLAIIFSVFYWVHYHTLGTGDLPKEAYATEQAEAARLLEERAAQNPVSNESLIEMSMNPTILAEAEAWFKEPTKCAQCHKPDGSGLTGPNLTDEWWVYGNEPMDIYTTIANGRLPDPEKGYIGGMLPWRHFGDMWVRKMTAYVLSIKDKNLPGKEHMPYAKKVSK